ncbi:MAG: serine/threonine-protein kinase [Pseudomonadota bacterium]
MLTGPNALRDLKPGAQLANRYSLVRKLGQGGEAVIWLAQDRMTRSTVALKILASLEGNRARLREEWQIGVRLLHPHIVRAFEFHDDAAGAFYSLQYIDGPDISVLAGQAPAAVLPLIAALADALRYAHGKGLVHRDIKASNVLLDGNGAAYLIDFGVAARTGEQVSGGAPIAGSPEQQRGAAATPADDIFALGGLAYELLSGRSPYADPAHDIASTVPPPLTSAGGAALPDPVVDLVAAMLAKDAAERPDAAAVLELLSAAGFPPGTAPRDVLGAIAGAVNEEVIEVRERQTPRAGAMQDGAAPPVAATGSRGLTPRTVMALLALLVALLFAVVFYLPGTVDPAATADRQDEIPADSGPVAAEGQPAPPDDTSSGLPQRDQRVEARQATEAVLGRLLANMETLEARAVERWGGVRYAQAKAAYEQGDEAYLARYYARATADYEQAIELIEPLLDEVDEVFASTLSAAETALANADSIEALKNFDLAVAISPGSRRAQEGLTRARNLDRVLDLVDAGLRYEEQLELDAARESFKQAMDLDEAWQPAREGHRRVLATAKQMEFDARMSEGLSALAVADYASARAAFRVAQQLKPDSAEPKDGLMQVDQGIRLTTIGRLEREVAELEAAERWADAVTHYERILELDGNLEFAKTGLADARNMVNLHRQLDEYIAEPDALSAPATLQRATNIVLAVTRMDNVGPRLTGQKDELSRLMKRAATPLTVELRSDELTDVSVYRVARLGSFSSQQLKLRPGTYVAVGSRPGFRDVRVEFRVAPELDMQPVVVRCEEPI